MELIIESHTIRLEDSQKSWKIATKKKKRIPAILENKNKQKNPPLVNILRQKHRNHKSHSI